MSHQNFSLEEREAWLQLAFTPYIGAESFLRLLKHFGSAQAALNAPAEAVAGLACKGRKAAAAWRDTAKARAAAEAALAWERQDGCRLLLLNDAAYPMPLAQGIAPPPVLFVRGDAAMLHRPAVAVVGSRHCTPQAQADARAFAEGLAARGIAVVSGMAAGIDAAAHRGALRQAGGTVAVWGTGIDRVYPAAHRSLAHEIAAHGAIVSEFPLGTAPAAGHFPRRNRLIAGLAQAVLVVEAALESGSLITARLAAEMGREVMALPGSIHNPHSKGCHKLIKDGAKLVETIDDIVQECAVLRVPPAFQAACAAPQTTSAPAAPQDPLWAQMGGDPVHPDQLAERCGADAAEVYARLLEWELAGAVAAVAGGRFQKIQAA